MMVAVQFSQQTNSKVNYNHKVDFTVVRVSLLVILSCWQVIKPQNVQSFPGGSSLTQGDFILYSIQSQRDKLKFPLSLNS